MSNIEKTVVFIDDGPDRVKEMLNTIVSRLWEKNISVLMMFLGDFEKTDFNLSDTDFKKQLSGLKASLFNEFTNFLIHTKRYHDNDVLQYYHLINSDYQYDPNKIDTAFDPEVNIVVDKNTEDNENLFKKFKAINANAFNQYIATDGKIEKNKFNSEYSVQQIVDSLELDENAVILMDMCLLEGDLNKLENIEEFSTINFVYDNKSQNTFILPLLSMSMLNYLIMKHSVIMYTSYDFTTDMVESWLKTYTLIYGENDISFYNRIGKKILGNGNDELIKEIEEKIKNQGV